MCIGLRRDRLSWTVPGRVGETRSQALSLEACVDVSGPEGVQARLDLARDFGAIAAQASPGRRVEVVLADELARYWVMSAPSGLSSLEALREVARARCSQLFGPESDDWVIHADWQVSAPLLCVAVPGWLIAALSRVFGARVQVRTVLGVLLGAAAHRLPSEGWACIIGPRQVVLLRTQDGTTHAVRTVAVEDGSQGEALLHRAAMELRRQSLRERSSLPASIAWLDVTGRASASVTVDGLVFHPVAVPWLAGAGRTPGACDEVEIASWQATHGSPGT